MFVVLKFIIMWLFRVSMQEWLIIYSGITNISLYMCMQPIYIIRPNWVMFCICIAALLCYSLNGSNASDEQSLPVRNI